ncbi:MAG TPA: hypothetical protein ENJ77_01550 [Candidatus Moranbacteria bacterium]|nr:hypothetical protein [Candidatus Moranbacteria bacterium]
MSSETKIEIRDNRGNKRYFIDDLFYDVYARLTAPHGLPVYNALCRRANKRQKSWPGVDVMAAELGISRKSVFAGLEILEYLRIIKRERVGKKVTNRYTLLARTSWRKDWEVMFLEVTSPKKSEVPLRYFTSFSEKLHKFLRVTSIGRKHREGNTEKDAEASSAPLSERKKCRWEECDEQVHEASDWCRDHTPMTVDQFIAWTEKSNQAHIRLIGQWADIVRKSLIQQTRGQWEHYIRRNAKTARVLSRYSIEQLGRAYARVRQLQAAMARENKHFNPSLETLEKELTK